MVCGSVAAQSLTLTSPNGGESWAIGSQKNITWTANNVSGNLRILLAKNNALVGVIAKNLNPADGSYTWTVGNYEGGKAVPGSGYQMRIQVMGGGIHDDIDDTFSITISLSKRPPLKPKVLKIERPNPLSNWKIHEKQNIIWEAFPKPEYFYIDLYNYNGTQKVESIFEGTIEPFSGSKYRYNWNIPNIMSEPDLAKYQIKILAVTSAGTVDGFSSMFSISKPWEKKHVVLNAAQIVNHVLQRSLCDSDLWPMLQEKPGKVRVGHVFYKHYVTMAQDTWCGWLFRSRFHFPLAHLKGKVKLLLEAKLRMRNAEMMLENSSTISTSKQHTLFVLTSDLPNIFQIPNQYFYSNFDYELDVTQLVREWIQGTAVNFGFVAAGPVKNFLDNQQNYVIAYRPELEIWYLENK
jgi:hypothetical protein